MPHPLQIHVCQLHISRAKGSSICVKAGDMAEQLPNSELPDFGFILLDDAHALSADFALGKQDLGLGLYLDLGEIGRRLLRKVIATFAIGSLYN